MNQEEIRQLLETYYSGESTLAEENLLREFFSRDDIPADMKAERDVFRFFADSRDMPEPSADFEDRILSAIDDAEGKFGKRRLFTILSGVAATLLLIAGSYFFFFNERPMKDTYSDPDIAYAETMKILYDVSARLNKGTKALGRINLMEIEAEKGLEKMNRSTAIFTEQLKPLNSALGTMKKTGTENRNR
jgi:hypothetical protein